MAPFQYRLQTDQKPGPLSQGSWALDGYTEPLHETEESFSCMGKCSGGDFLLGLGGHCARTTHVEEEVT